MTPARFFTAKAIFATLGLVLPVSIGLFFNVIGLGVPLVIPAGATIRVITQGADVIHSFFVPSLGVQKYTIPGRTMETWMKADRAGLFYGQCNQICGTNHWFMPIVVRAVPPAEFEAWVASARTRFASTMTAPALAAAPINPIHIAQAPQ